MSPLPSVLLRLWVAGWPIWLDSNVNQAKALSVVSVLVTSVVSTSDSGT